MGFLTEIALFFLGLIGIYVGLHDFLGLNIISYSVFDAWLAPFFIAFLFIVFASIVYWVYRIYKQPLKKNALEVLKLSVVVSAIGIFLTSMPLEVLTTSKLIFGKILIFGGLALGVLAVKVHRG